MEEEKNKTLTPEETAKLLGGELVENPPPMVKVINTFFKQK